MNKCEGLQMGHVWEDTAPNVIYPSFPPQYPPRREKCLNCGLIRFFKEKRSFWIEYDHSEEKQD